MVLVLVAVLVAVSLDRHKRRSSSAASPIVRIAQVGRATTFASTSSGRAATSVPDGVRPGMVLVSYVESYPFAAITCATGGTKALDVANGAHTHLVACWKVAAAGDPPPAALVVPPTAVSMVTMAFDGADPGHPVGAAAAVPGTVSPSVATGVPNALLVLGEGSDTWQAVAQPPPGSTFGATVNDGGNSHVAAAAMRSGAVGPSRPNVWTVAPPTTEGAAGSIVLQPAAGSRGGVVQPPPSESAAQEAATPSSTTSRPPDPTSSPPGPDPARAPSAPPALICGNSSELSGPPVPPTGAIVVPAGDNSSVDWSHPDTTFWFARGTHTLGTSGFSQIMPARGTTFVGAPGAVIDGQGVNYSAFTTTASGVTVKYMTIQHFNSFVDQGVVNHDSGEGWTISHNTITENHGAAVMIGSENTVADNCLSNNGQYGFNAYSAASSPRAVVLEHNEITGNNSDNLEVKRPGCGCTGGGKFWHSIDATATDNYVHDNRSVGLWADGDNVGFAAEGNYFSGNDAEGMIYEVSYNALIKHNTFVRNGLVKGPRIDGFPVAALYVSESGGDARVPTARRYTTLDISGNVFTDNWGGIVLWENADRFCGNGEAKFCTLVNPSAVIDTCVAALIAQPPLYADCRWKTQNVMVHDNTFTLVKANVAGCAAARTCGDQGLFSNFGTYPTFSPYRAGVIADAISFDQNNHFFHNSYNGDWHFIAHTLNTVLDFASWQSSPYHQDAGSAVR